MDKFFVRLLILCVLITGALFAGRTWLLENGNHFNVLLIGNFLLAVITAISYRMLRIGQEADKPAVFVRMKLGSTLFKLMVILAGTLTYILIYRPFVSKITIFILMGFYVVYTLVETGSAMRFNKPRS